MYRVARNHCIDRLRAGGKNTGLDDLADPARDPPAELEHRREVEAVHRFMAERPETRGRAWWVESLNARAAAAVLALFLGLSPALLPGP